MAHILSTQSYPKGLNSTPKRETQQVDEGPIFLTSRDVAYILDCTPDDVVNLARKGQLPAVKQGKFWKFYRADVMVYQRLKEKGEKRIAKIA